MTSSISILVLGKHAERRLVAVDAFRNDGSVVVEVTTVHQANAMLEQLQFDILAVDLFDLGVEAIQLFHDMSVDHPDVSISVMELPIDRVDRDVVSPSHSVHLPHRPISFNGNQRRARGAKAKHGYKDGSGPVDGLNQIRGNL